MLDTRLPDVTFSGRDDLYALLRETREYVNKLEERIKNLEGIKGFGTARSFEPFDVVTASTEAVKDSEVYLSKDGIMANTSSNPALRVTKMKAKKRK